ncbi:phage major capsid protein, P2 family [Mannheimia sp. E30BD]|uniref:phage major capsid protein, P2 family n=1 Tax=Mannheimia sp. E30BD TaxID=3278708 RepID=UPI00359E0905
MFNEFLDLVAARYGIDPNVLRLGQSFNVNPTEAAELAGNIQQQSDFLSKINVIGVVNVKGRKIFGATEKAITGRKQNGRHLASIEASENTYELHETDTGVLIPWEYFDNLAGLGVDRLMAGIAQFVNQQTALDMCQIGWFGERVSPTTSDKELKDVNIGWLKLLETKRPANVYKGKGSSGQEKIKIYGADAEFSCLDELALDLRQGLDPRHQNRNDLVFLVGRELAAKESKIISKQHGLKPTERAALGSKTLLGSFGGMEGLTPPNFPAKGAVVTTLENLSIYYQKTSVRRSLRNDEDKKGYVNSYYRNEGYVVEDYGLMTAIKADNVEFGEDE